jgi:hypothetical protein
MNCVPIIKSHLPNPPRFAAPMSWDVFLAEGRLHRVASGRAGQGSRYFRRHLPEFRRFGYNRSRSLFCSLDFREMMPGVTVSELVPILQTAIGPALLISGVGLLLLTMTNRLGRVVDRARLLVAQLEEASPELRTRKLAQLPILWRRARQIRAAIALALVSALLASVLIVLLFLFALLGIEDSRWISGLFVLCMGTLIASLVMFLQEINQSLHALKVELEEERRKTC